LQFRDAGQKGLRVHLMQCTTHADMTNASCAHAVWGTVSATETTQLCMPNTSPTSDQRLADLSAGNHTAQAAQKQQWRCLRQPHDALSIERHAVPSVAKACTRRSQSTDRRGDLTVCQVVLRCVATGRRAVPAVVGSKPPGNRDTESHAQTGNSAAKNVRRFSRF
jgi:hypothetical protein